MVFKSCGSMLPIVAVVVWGSIVQGRIFSRGCLGCICSKGAFLAVILHPKGKAMDSASISFREELRLDAPQRTGFPEQLPFGMGTASYEG